ncbi:MAG: hypothetical protein LBR15_04085, partial [Methanobrevibacter sp.]|nr:hypothetical protein [Candidatus Methanovirga australis]
MEEGDEPQPWYFLLEQTDLVLLYAIRRILQNYIEFSDIEFLQDERNRYQDHEYCIRIVGTHWRRFRFNKLLRDLYNNWSWTESP